MSEHDCISSQFGGVVAPWIGLFGGAVRPPLLLVVSAIAERGSKSFVADSNLKEVSKLHSKDEDFSICR